MRNINKRAVKTILTALCGAYERLELESVTHCIITTFIGLIFMWSTKE
ncbi:hypothetical protein HMPREF0663_12037 [Hoylesella oralis ATCC 33269]|uniref:Uncharacterized protein n=1 Tax=Hoylesella oralis ATCC 33269 TaxID=873533 RepID=E7RTG4_9BACT|nr:hypothetical protein HMPREF0663_12037 [Hoylesella oralis ATCC 33269]